VIGLLDEPTKGRVAVERRGHSVVSRRGAGAASETARCGFIFQTFHLIRHLSVGRQRRDPPALPAHAQLERRKQALAALDRVGLTAPHPSLSVAASRAVSSSGVAYRRAIVGHPRIRRR